MIRKDSQRLSTSLSNSSEHDGHALCRVEGSVYNLITLWSSSVLSYNEIKRKAKLRKKEIGIYRMKNTPDYHY